MDPIRCLCKKEARRVLVGSNFIYYDCEDGVCGYEMPLCHCKKICQLVTSQSINRTQYFICSQCNFVIACCNCNRICNIKISRTQLNPGLIFWSCKQYPNNQQCDTWVPIKSSLTSHFQKINYLEFVCNLWKYMKANKFKDIFANFIAQTEHEVKDLIGNIENEDLYNEIKSMFENNYSRSILQGASSSESTTPTTSRLMNIEIQRTPTDNQQSPAQPQSLSQVMIGINNIKKRAFEEFQEDLINEKEKILEQFQEDLLTEKGISIDNFKKDLTAETDQSFDNYKAVLNYIKDNKIKEFEAEAGKTDVGNKLTEICKMVDNNDQKLLELCKKFDSIFVEPQPNRPITRSAKKIRKN